MSTPAPQFRANLFADLIAKTEVDGTLEGVQVAYFWLGPDQAGEGIYLGDLDSGEVVSGTFVPTQIKLGRQRYNADEVIPFTCQSFIAAGAENPAGAEAAVQRVELFAGEVIDTIQANPAMSQAADWVPSITYRTVIANHGPGWAARCIGQITLHDRLN